MLIFVRTTERYHVKERTQKKCPSTGQSEISLKICPFDLRRLPSTSASRSTNGQVRDLKGFGAHIKSGHMSDIPCNSPLCVVTSLVQTHGPHRAWVCLRYGARRSKHPS